MVGLQAAEKAAAQSNREISGYRIESISLTHERQEHYLRKHVGLAGPSGPLAGLQPGGSAGIADSFPGYPSAEQLGSISGFPSQLVSPLPPDVLHTVLSDGSLSSLAILQAEQLACGCYWGLWQTGINSE